MATKPATPQGKTFAKPITPNHSTPAVESECTLALKAAIQAGLIGPVQLRLPGF